MSEEELSAIEKEIQQLHNQETELYTRRLELSRKQVELQKAAEIANTFVEITARDYIIETDKVYFIIRPYREDVVAWLRTITSHNWNGIRNSVDREDWLTYMHEVRESIPKNVNVLYDDEALRALIVHGTQVPDYSITLEKKFYKVLLGRNGVANPLVIIPGKEWKHEQNTFLIPLSEGWRLYNNLRAYESKYRIQWQDEALQAAIKQSESRNTLIKIANAEDWDIDPYFIDGTLRPFQRVGVAFAEAANGRWMTCDEMGLGKTWQALGFANRAIEKNERFTTLVVVPASLKNNWTREIKARTGLNPYVCSGELPQNFDMVEVLTRKHRFYIINYDIFATSKELEDVQVDDAGVRSVKRTKRWPWVETFMLAKFDFVIFDEGHYIKNSSSARSKAAKLLVTGIADDDSDDATPVDAERIPHVAIATGTPVVNRVDELWPMLNLIDPETFTTKERFTRQYSSDGRTARNVEELREILKFIMIRRLKKDVVKELPALETIIRFHELSDKAQKLYNKVLAGIYEVIAEYEPGKAGESRKITHILAQIMRMKQVCAIDKIKETADLAVEMYDNNPEGEKNGKVIIFTQFKATCKAIARRLGSEALYFDGDIELNERQNLVDQFQTDPDIHFMVMTNKVAAEGHNITAANHVIFNDLFWTPKDHQQCIGRAYGRLSNLHGATAYYVICEGTIENYIQRILDQKTMLIGQVVDGKMITGDESVNMELISKMREELFNRKKAS